MSVRVKYHCAVCGGGIPARKWGKHMERCRARAGTRKPSGVQKPPLQRDLADRMQEAVG